MCSIIADKREREVLAAARAANITIREEHLTTGDYLILAPDGAALLVIERKTWPDLAASIKDGRIENIEKLKSFSAETAARIAYLIEGPHPRRGQPVANMPYKCLRAHLDHLLIRENVLEIQTANKKDTAARLEELARNLSTLTRPTTGCAAPTESTNALELAKKKIVVSDDKVVLDMWASIPKIGPKTARLLAARGSFLEATNDPATFFKETKFGAALKKRENQVKVLAAIPGISPRIAAALLESCPFESINAAALSVVKIGGKTFGATRAEKIYRYFTFKGLCVE